MPVTATDMSSKSTPHSIWLLPETALMAQLGDIVARLASQYQAPEFIPHVTLAGELEVSTDASTQVCLEYFQNIGPIQATIKRLERSDAHFLSVYFALSFEYDFIPFRLAVTPAQNQVFQPHISLAYGVATQDVLDPDICAKMDDFVGRAITFDKVAVVHSASFIPTQDWSILKTVQL